LAIVATVLVVSAHASAATLSSNPEGDAVIAFRFPEESASAPSFAALRPAGGVFGQPARLTPRSASDVDVAAGPGGLAVAAWTEAGGAVRASVRDAGSGWGPPVTLAKRGEAAKAAIDSAGGALVVWTDPGGGARGAARPPGGPFESAHDLPGSGLVEALEMDAAGDALVLSLVEQPSRALIRSSYRPAGGQFGDARDLATVRSSYDRPRLAMNAAGDAIAVFPTKDAGLAASRRPAGGEFEPAVPVTDGHPDTGYATYSTTIDDVALGGDGSVAVAWTTRTFSDDFGETVRVFAALAPGGGPFGRRLRLSTPERPGYDARAAIDGAGDTVVAWGDPRFSVHAIYRPAGGSFGAPVRLAGPRLGGLPDVSIDGRGQATAAWQQSDGERVELATRTFDAGGAGTPAQVLKWRPAFEPLPHAGARCRPPHTRTLIESRYARVFSELRTLHHIKYACLLRRGKPIALEYAFDDFPVTAAGPPAMALAGPLLAYTYNDEQCGTCGGRDGLTVRDLRTGRTANGFGPEGDPDPNTFDYGRIRRLVLRRDTALAYIQCFSRCRSSHLFKIDSGAAGPVLVAKGAGIDPHFLRLANGRVRWRQAGRVHSAPLG
jgi:hypothetical protein